MPMIDLSVVVLPAPLRPSSVTTSPAKTSKSTPCNTWDSPYQACSPSIESKGPAPALGMADPEIGFPHVRVGRYRFVVAFGEHPATREDRDAIGEARNDAEIMLDHQHCAVGSDRFDQRANALDV